ncbi:hypothetical protein [Phyllobacterium zundukense]|uniref:Uncharacterized protein n=1 Tax=Phyllobacterium zundukense TaxID=1867719 RepID=A0ACD4D381_9HYPH|nr:hypothetical protein [Phyllobacterium zundukense]UXN60190.1 hypothetical protein N8E88_27340 [Phyllobacterium zundukense]
MAMLGGCDGDGGGTSDGTSTFTPPVTPPVKTPEKPTETIITDKLDLKIPPFIDKNPIPSPNQDAPGIGIERENNLTDKEPSVDQTISAVPDAGIREPVITGDGIERENNLAGKEQSVNQTISTVPDPRIQEPVIIGDGIDPVNNLADKEPSIDQTISTVPDARVQDQVVGGIGIERENNPIGKVPQIDQTSQPPAPSNPKKVGIYSLQYHSFKQVSARGEVGEGTPGAVRLAGEAKIFEGIESYLKRSLDNRFALLYRAMVTAFEKRSPKEFDVSFVTAPEFYWNVPFGDFWTKEELELGADLCLNTVTKHVKTLIKKFPAHQYGHIVLLPGTIAMLKPMTDPRKPNGTPVGGSTIYEAFNQVVCTHNLPLNDGKKRPAYMIWPKRVVSHIDYFDELGDKRKRDAGCDGRELNSLMPNPSHPGLKNPILKCTTSIASNVKVRIGYVTSSVGSSYDSNDNLITGKFQNDIIEGLPFGIDICLDYSAASVQLDQHRISQLNERHFKLDFLLAAGMGLDINNYAKTPHIQYAIRNEGIGGTTGEVEVWKLSLDKEKPKAGTKFVKISDGYRIGTPMIRIETDIRVNQNEIFDAPKNADTKDIPNILDKMNPGLVSVWSLDTVQPAGTVIASNPAPMTTVADKTIQFIK